MEVSSISVGYKFSEYETVINWRDTMNYAACLGDNNQYYLNDELEEGVVASPMYAVAVTWPVSEKIVDYIQEVKFPPEILTTQVHYTEHLQFHQPIRPGDNLKIEGKIAAILPHRAGTHIVMRFDALDSGQRPVFTEHLGAMMRGVKCSDKGKGQEDLPQVPEYYGQESLCWEQEIFIDTLQPFIYDGCTNIVFPIHTSAKFARGVGLPGRILQGTSTLAYAVREIINYEADGDPLALKCVSCRFSNVVLPGTPIKVKLLHKDKRDRGTDIFFIVLNAEGQKAISKGYARILKE